MPQFKTYGQFCGLARALDRVGDRWTLLIVRELLLGDRTFRDLVAALPGISPSLLTRRLGELSADRLVERNEAPRRSRNVEYRLTSAGRSLEPAILALIRWGTVWMLRGPGDDRVDPRWASLALRALLEGHPSRPGVVHLDVEGIPITISSVGETREVLDGHLGVPDATLTLSLPTLLAITSDSQVLNGAGVEISGNPNVAHELLTIPHHNCATS